MRLHKLAVALAALSITGAAVAAGNDMSTSTIGAASHQPSSQQAAPSSSDPSSTSQAAPSASDQSGSSQMGSSSAGGSASSEQNNPELVRSAQQALKQKGFDAGAVDGQMGPSTEGALRKFQEAQGLPQSGNLDQQTLSALGVNQSEGGMNQGATSSPGSQSKGTTSSQGAANTSASYK